VHYELIGLWERIISYPVRKIISNWVKGKKPPELSNGVYVKLVV